MVRTTLEAVSVHKVSDSCDKHFNLPLCSDTTQAIRYILPDVQSSLGSHGTFPRMSLLRKFL